MKLGSSLGFATIIIARWPWSIRIGDSFFKATGGFTLAFCNSEWPPCSPPGSGPAGASGGEAVGRRQAPWDTNCPSELKTPGSHQTGKCEAHGAPSSSHQKAPPYYKREVVSPKQQRSLSYLWVPHTAVILALVLSKGKVYIIVLLSSAN